MATRPGSQGKQRLSGIIVFALLLLTVLLAWTLSVGPGRADGGGFPTSTSALVFPTSTNMAFPTSTNMIFPTSTNAVSFPTATLPFPTVILPSSEGQVVVAETPTPTPAASPSRQGLAYLCWPMGLALIVAAIIGATFIFRRVVA